MSSSSSNALFFFFFFLCSIFFSTTLSALNTTNPSIKSFCNSTPYPDSCLHSLKLSINISINPTTVTFLLQALQTAISESLKLSGLLSAAGRPNLAEKQKGSVEDCRELHQITVKSLQRSVNRVNAGGPTKLADARAYLAAALTNKNTCLEGLESATGPLKSVIVDSVVETYKHVGNSLAILSRSSGTGETNGGRSRRLLGFPARDPRSSGAGGSNGGRNGTLLDFPTWVPRSSGAGGWNKRLLGFPAWDHRSSGAGSRNRGLLGFPAWVRRRDRRILEGDYDGYDSGQTLTVAGDGSGNFTTIGDAINFAPNNSYDRIIIYVKEGVYEENVEIPSSKTNIVLLGDGVDLTVVTGARSVAGGWTTFRSATVAVSGDGFLARDITFENTAGPESHQAVALRINADFAALYRCAVSGYQDTLYAHSFRQFYRQCDISGTVDFIFGNAAAVFQASNIISKLPLKGQYTVITAQSRETPDEDTGFSLQNCSVLAADDLYSDSAAVKSYLGRPWRPFSRTVVLESYIDDFIDRSGWREWSASDGSAPETVYYGEYENYGPGSGTDNRVGWGGFHVMGYDDAYNFTVSEFITGDAWLDSTSFPYDDGV